MMFRSLLALLLLSQSPSLLSQQKSDRALERRLTDMAKGFNGRIGIHVISLKDGRTASINADSLFPTASMIKLPILLGVMDKIERNELSYTQELIYRDSLLYEGVDILGSFKDSEKIELGKVMMLMLTMSDNTASLWLQSLAGTGERINKILDSLGFVNTRVNSRTPGREEARKTFGWGQTSPREMARLMQLMYERRLLSVQASEKMLRLTGRNFWDDVSLSEIPPGIFVSSKNGAVDESRSEVVLVFAPHAPYIFCVCTSGNKDQSWEPSNEAWTLTRRISALLWHHFEPSSKWKAGH